MATDLPDVRFQISYPEAVDQVSASRAGSKLVSVVEYGDSFWQIPMRTVPLTAAERLRVEAFKDRCRGGLVTVIYTPKHMCLPRAYWGNAGAAVLANGTLTAKSGHGVTVSATNGLVLSPGDLVSFSTGDYHWMARIEVGGTVAGGSRTLTLNMPVPSYIATGAVVRFKDPRLNTRMVPGSFSMPDEFNPVASFMLVEVPK